MRTPAKWNKKLHQNIITEKMLEVALYSVNKRAKNWRDKKREYRHYWYDKYDNAGKAEANEQKMYALKEKMLGFIKPTCIHQEFGGYEKERIFDYEQNFPNKFIKSALNDEIVWVNSYVERDEWGYCDTEDTCFFDRIDKTKPISRWYLWYIVGGHTFHTPIEECDVDKYVKQGLEIIKISTLNTSGDDILELASMPFVKKVIALIESGNAVYEELEEKSLLPDYPIGWKDLEVDTIYYSVPEMINFAFDPKASSLANQKLREITNPDIKELSALSSRQESNIKLRIWRKYAKGRDVSLNYILEANFLKKDVSVEIDYQKVREELLTFNEFTRENVADCLVKYANVEVFKENFNKQKSVKKYVCDHWKEILQDTLSNVPEQYEKQRQKNLARVEEKRRKVEEKRKRKAETNSQKT